MNKGLEDDLTQYLSTECFFPAFGVSSRSVMRLSSCRLRRSIHHALEARHARYTAMQAFVRGVVGPLQLASTPRSMLLHGSRPLLTGEKEKGRKLAEASGLACGPRQEPKSALKTSSVLCFQDMD